jgi:excisionase family DNA binding protein
MITEQTLTTAKRTAATLRERGEVEGAAAVEALVEAARDDAVPALDLLTSSQAGELLGVTGQTIKNWVRAGHLTGYRVGGRIMVPKEAVAAYVQHTRQSLDLEELSDEEAARLVAEGRRRPV